MAAEHDAILQYLCLRDKHKEATKKKKINYV